MIDTTNLNIRSSLSIPSIVQYAGPSYETNPFGDVRLVSIGVYKSNAIDVSKSLYHIFNFYFNSWPTEGEFRDCVEKARMKFVEYIVAGTLTTISQPPKSTVLKYP